MPFLPRADTAVLTVRNAQPSKRPDGIVPVADPQNVASPCQPWSLEHENTFYPEKADPYAITAIPDKPANTVVKHLLPRLAKNERLRLSMLWYYTRDIWSETELLAGLQEKAVLAQEATGWDMALIGTVDTNTYTRLASVGAPFGALPRSETMCGHTVLQPPGSVFLLPNIVEDWRFQNAPHCGEGGLKAYASAPLRLQDDTGEVVNIGSFCVCSPTPQAPLNVNQQRTLAQLADWVVSDIAQCARTRRQRERRRLMELLSSVQTRFDGDIVHSERLVTRMLQTVYSDCIVSLRPSQATCLDIGDRCDIPLADFENGLWEDTAFMDDFIMRSNHLDLPEDRIVRVITGHCETVSGPSLLAVASKDFRMVFDDIDLWFIQSCASLISQLWRQVLLSEVMKAKEKFLRGVCHQLRTPIHGILGSVELLAEELKSRRDSYDEAKTPVAEPSSGYLDNIRASGRDLISIVNSMITLNRWADIAMTQRLYEPYAVDDLEADLREEVVKFMSGDPRYRTSVFFHSSLPPGFEGFKTDRRLFRDSLLPLIINAIQNTPRGLVTVTTSLHPDNKRLEVHVKDNGRGIQHDNQHRIFEAYEQVGVHSTGAGLGLTLALKYAALLKGSVSLLSSQPDHGSHFVARFDDIESVPSPTVTPASAMVLSHLPPRFLHIPPDMSDQTELCNQFTDLLVSQGFESAKSWEEDSFYILDMVPEEQRIDYLAKLPGHKVALTLVPVPDDQESLNITRERIVYLQGPFSRATVAQALHVANALLAKVEAERTAEACLGNLAIRENKDPAEGPLLSEVSLTTAAVHDDMTNISASESRNDVTPSQPSRVTTPISASVPRSPKPMALLVDDNVVNLRIMQMYCKKRSLPYVCAMDGQQAVTLFTKHQSFASGYAAIQLILMDLQMPVCDGIEATRQIRQLEKENQWGQSAVFIVTGQDDIKNKTAADKVGADEYFVKPLGIKLLDREVKKYFPAFDVV